MLDENAHRIKIDTTCFSARHRIGPDTMAN